MLTTMASTIASPLAGVKKIGIRPPKKACGIIRSSGSRSASFLDNNVAWLFSVLLPFSPDFVAAVFWWQHVGQPDSLSVGHLLF